VLSRGRQTVALQDIANRLIAALCGLRMMLLGYRGVFVALRHAR
jgi:hypothetical protein